jgi:hypothetical protein
LFRVIYETRIEIFFNLIGDREMKFADHIIRNNLDLVFIKSSESEFELRDEYNSNLWDIKTMHINKNEHLYEVPARAVKIGENIYHGNGQFLTYRSE